jgi:hypothetical protein
LVSTGAMVIALLRASMGTLLIYLKPKREQENNVRGSLSCNKGGEPKAPLPSLL